MPINRSSYVIVRRFSANLGQSWEELKSTVYVYVYIYIYIYIYIFSEFDLS